MGIMAVGNRFAKPSNAPKVGRMNPSDPPLNFAHEPGPVSYPSGSVVDFQASYRRASYISLALTHRTFL